MSNPEFRWDGPHEAVTVVLPSGRTLTRTWAGTIEALPSEVDALDALDGWTRLPAGDDKKDQK